MAELPGVKKENINVEVVNDNTIVLTGEFGEELSVPASDAPTGTEAKTPSGYGAEDKAASSTVTTAAPLDDRGVVLAKERVLGAFRR